MAEHDLRCTCFRLRRAARAITQLYDRELEPGGVTVTQFSILAELSRSGAQPTSTLAARMGMDRTTMTRTLKPLRREGLLADATSADGRVRAVGLTAEGERRFVAGVPLWRNAEREIARSLGAEGTEGLYALLRKVEKAAAGVAS